MELDGLVGLPNGVKPAPIKYNLGKINKYLNEIGKWVIYPPINRRLPLKFLER